jgi:hypothetical protein
MYPESSKSIYEQREEKRKKIKKIVFFSIYIGIIILILFFGYFLVIKSGSNNPVSDSLKNLGTKFVGEEEKKEDYNKPIELAMPDWAKNSSSSESKIVVLSATGTNYNITVKKELRINFRNETGAPVRLRFSDNRELGFNIDEEKTIVFARTGEYTFEDLLDNTRYRITGKVKITD